MVCNKVCCQAKQSVDRQDVWARLQAQLQLRVCVVKSRERRTAASNSCVGCKRKSRLGGKSDRLLLWLRERPGYCGD